MRSEGARDPVFCPVLPGKTGQNRPKDVRITDIEQILQFTSYPAKNWTKHINGDISKNELFTSYFELAILEQVEGDVLLPPNESTCSTSIYIFRVKRLFLPARILSTCATRNAALTVTKNHYRNTAGRTTWAGIQGRITTVMAGHDQNKIELWHHQTDDITIQPLWHHNTTGSYVYRAVGPWPTEKSLFLGLLVMGLG